MCAEKKGGRQLETDASLDLEPGSFRLRVTKDKMAVLLDCDSAMWDLQDLAEAVVERLKAFGVEHVPVAFGLLRLIRSHAERSPQLEGVRVLEGVVPIPPVDGRIEWGGDFFNKNFVIDEDTDQVNFRQLAGQRNVKKGQLLARVIEPIPGESGHDVLGARIRARRPLRRRVRLGNNVCLDESTQSYYSEIDGRIRFVNGILAVDDLFEVEGDVGLKTGDISHPGAVIVHGDVLVGSRLEAVGDIEVLGVVESAHVQTSGKLIVHGGITGAVGSHIVALGGVLARFIFEADVQSDEDVVVGREIVQSRVLARGSVCVPRGRIVGGSITALEGVDVGQLGSSAMSPTEVTAGEDFSLAGRLQIVRSRIEVTQRNIARINDALAPLRGKIAALPEEKKGVVRKLLEQLRLLNESIGGLVEEEEDIAAESAIRKRALIVVRNHLYPEVRLRLEDAALHVRDGRRGPLKAIYVDESVQLSTSNVRGLTDKKK